MLATRALTAADLPAMEALHEAAKCDAPIGIETIGNGDAAKFLTLAQRVLLAEDFQLFGAFYNRSEEHTSELQSRGHLVCRLLLEKKKNNKRQSYASGA